jgi:SAM-dependent methyltransferase
MSAKAFERWRELTSRAALSATYGHVMSAEGRELHELHLGWFEDVADSLGAAQERYLKELIEPLGLRASHRVLDVGCGPGGVAIWTANRFGCRVHGIDLVPAHVDRACTAAAEAGSSVRVQFQKADARRLPFADGSFDRALSVEALYHVHPRSQAARELARVVVPGGRVAFSEYVLAPATPQWARLVCALLTGSARLAEASAAPVNWSLCGFASVHVRDVSRETLAGTWAWSQARGHRDFVDYYLAPYRVSWLKSALIALTERVIREGWLRVHFVSAVRSTT